MTALKKIRRERVFYLETEFTKISKDEIIPAEKDNNDFDLIIDNDNLVIVFNKDKILSALPRKVSSVSCRVYYYTFDILRKKTQLRYLSFIRLHEADNFRYKSSMLLEDKLGSLFRDSEIIVRVAVNIRFTEYKKK